MSLQLLGGTLPQGWTKHYSDLGCPYYVNEVTKVRVLCRLLCCHLSLRGEGQAKKKGVTKEHVHTVKDPFN